MQFFGNDYNSELQNESTSASPEIGSHQDFINRSKKYIYIILLILFVHTPKVMVVTIALVIMCDPTFTNFLFLAWFFVGDRLAVHSRSCF